MATPRDDPVEQFRGGRELGGAGIRRRRPEIRRRSEIRRRQRVTALTGGRASDERADRLAAVDESPPCDGLVAARRRDGATDA